MSELPTDLSVSVEDGERTLVVRAVDESRWDDLLRLFGPSGAQRGCWCMHWRLPSTEFEANAPPDNRTALRAAVDAGRPIGLLGYADGEPLAWCALAPTVDYARVLRSRLLAPADGEHATTWSVPCVFILGGHRRRGLAGLMLHGAVRFARAAGIAELEGYPVDTEGGRRPGDIHSGTIGLFERAGFTLHRRPSTGRRVVMRQRLTED